MKPTPALIKEKIHFRLQNANSRMHAGPSLNERNSKRYKLDILIVNKYVVNVLIFHADLTLFVK